MSSTTGNIARLEVRCSCGKSCEDADTYLQHKKSCEEHRPSENDESATLNSDALSATTSARSCSLSSSIKPMTCWCGRTFRGNHAFGHHACSCAVHKQHKIVRAVHPRPVQVVEQASSLDSVLTAVGHLYSTPTAPAELDAIGKVMPNTAPRTSQSLAPIASSSFSDTDASTMLSSATSISCTCGYGSDTRKDSNLPKHDGATHIQHAGKAQAHTRPRVDSLITSFASMKLAHTTVSSTASVSKFDCKCGRKFTDPEAHIRHWREATRHAWRPREEQRKSFKTPRPQYQVNEGLQEQVALLARQY